MNHGRAERNPPPEPNYWASPKVKMPPSENTAKNRSPNPAVETELCSTPSLVGLDPIQWTTLWVIGQCTSRPSK